MARDIIIYGIDQERTLARIRSHWTTWQLPGDTLAHWLKVLAEPTIAGLQDLENLFLEQKDWTTEELYAALGAEELVAFRSRENGLALLALIDYYHAGFSWEGTDDGVFASSDGSALLPPETMHHLLDWLLAAAAVLAEDIDPNESNRDLDPVLLAEAGRMRQKSGFYPADFSAFGDMLYRIREWRDVILAAEGMDWFYLENSY
ncbi:hypothetical protein [Flavilitoribacter nigricans]|uniref:Uncharacterized protein n=1 Tax=Flavilitoribacter nigricans (strain ATCC 23147 / DSM 23189 / NBRC 102662 / NCIMB 1420 / SS-2) TaxID=1122177 RepID=A0A2D0NHD3_FLAN2|nr:hypothetical protein [Flavilitoribacter nigricans]PHN07895.1 hypothetical protein CRP01_03845 [Flavilitoribacter nigricans DSM 23189 = NBRC 102662]